MSEIQTVPPMKQMLTTQTLPWAFDFTAAIDSGETLSNPSAELILIRTGRSYPSGLLGSPAVTNDGTMVIQRVRNLPRGMYRLIVTAQTSVDKTPAGALLIEVPY